MRRDRVREREIEREGRGGSVSHSVSGCQLRDAAQYAAVRRATRGPRQTHARTHCQPDVLRAINAQLSTAWPQLQSLTARSHGGSLSLPALTNRRKQKITAKRHSTRPNGKL